MWYFPKVCVKSFYICILSSTLKHKIFLHLFSWQCFEVHSLGSLFIFFFFNGYDKGNRESALNFCHYYYFVYVNVHKSQTALRNSAYTLAIPLSWVQRNCVAAKLVPLCYNYEMHTIVLNICLAWMNVPFMFPIKFYRTASRISVSMRERIFDHLLLRTQTVLLNYALKGGCLRCDIWSHSWISQPFKLPEL